MDSSLVDLVKTHMHNFNARDYDAMIAAYAPDADILPSWTESRPTPREHVGAFEDPLIKAFPDLKAEIEEILTAGDEIIAFKWRWNGHHTEHYADVPPTGERITHQGITMMQIKDEKIVSERIVSASTPGPWQRVGGQEASDVARQHEPSDPDALGDLAHEFAHAFEARDADKLLDLYSPNAAIPPNELGKPFRNREERVEGFRTPWFTAFSSPTITVEQVATAGDVIAFKWRFEARHDGYFNDIAPTGREYTNSAISVFRVENGKITTERLFAPTAQMPWEQVETESDAG